MIKKIPIEIFAEEADMEEKGIGDANTISSGPMETIGGKIPAGS